MVPDYAKNCCAVADVLRDRTVLGRELVAGHGAAVLAGCRDIWCRDFMPIQVGQGFVQFLYAPQYLVKNRRWWDSITPPGLAYPDWLRAPGRVRVVPLVLDGGSIIGNERLALVSERVFRDNAGWTPSALKEVLAEALSVQHVEFVREQNPQDDFTGHLDGSIRIVSNRQAVVGVPPADPKPPAGCGAAYQRARRYSECLASIARRLEFEVIELIDVSYCAPAHPPYNVTGLYANFLQLGPRNLHLPCYHIPQDRLAQVQLERAGFAVTPVDVGELVDERHPELSGGALNCITWNWQAS